MFWDKITNKKVQVMQNKQNYILKKSWENLILTSQQSQNHQHMMGPPLWSSMERY